MTLLLNRSRFGVALRHNNAAQVGTMLAGRVLPGSFTQVFTKVNFAFAVLRREENAPAILGHLHIIEMSPATGIHANRRAQVDIEVMRPFWPHVLPPLQIVWLPMLQRTLQCAVSGQIDVVWDFLGIINTGHVVDSLIGYRLTYTRSQSKLAFSPLPYNRRAPLSPEAFGR